MKIYLKEKVKYYLKENQITRRSLFQGGIIISKSNYEKLQISRNGDKTYPDKSSCGAHSRWLETDGKRQRIITYPKGYEADHICYDGHSFYVIEGNIKIELGEEITKWRKGDAFIIPDNVPHRVFNSFKEDARVVVTDRG